MLAGPRSVTNWVSREKILNPTLTSLHTWTRSGPLKPTAIQQSSRTAPKLAPIHPTTKPPNSHHNSSFSSHRASLIARHLSTTTIDSTNMAHSFGVRKIGAPNTLEHRVYVEMNGQPVSAFHDVPLYANEEKTILNMIVEIPRWTNAKLEV